MYSGTRRAAGSSWRVVFGYLPRLLGVCANALPAADFEALLVRPSRSVFEAADAAVWLVCLAGALRCDRALPPAVFDASPVDLLESVLDALVAAGLLVTLRFLDMVLPFLLTKDSDGMADSPSGPAEIDYEMPVPRVGRGQMHR